MDDLALQVRVVDDVRVDDPERADACRGEVERRGRAEPAGADQQDARVEQLLLARVADLGDQQVTRVAAPLVRVSECGVSTSKPFRFQSVKPPLSEVTFS